MMIKFSSNSLIQILVGYLVVLIAFSSSPLAKAATGNLAQGAAAYAWASSVENAGLSAAAAVDGNSTTRWSSAFSDPQWIAVDLGGVYSINHVVLNWEIAYGKAYKIEVSTDGSHWTEKVSVTNGDGGIDDISFAPVDARFVRMLGTERGTRWGYSLYEFEVYGSDGGGAAADGTTSGGSTSGSGTATTGTNDGTTSGGSTSGSGTATTGTNTTPVTGTTTTGSLTLSWVAPVIRSDGSPMSPAEIDGYRIHFGKSSGNYTNHVTLEDGTAQSVTLTDIPVDTYYLVVSTYDVDGLESGYSAQVIAYPGNFH